MKKVISILIFLFLFPLIGNCQGYVIKDNVISKNSKIHTISAYLIKKTNEKKVVSNAVDDIIVKHFLNEKDFHLLKIFLYPSKKDTGYGWVCLYTKFEGEMGNYEFKEGLK